MDFINKDYSKYDPDNKIWKNGLFSAIIVLLIFVLFQPFGFRDKDIELKIILFPGYALLAFIYSYLNFHIVRHIIKKKKMWTLKDELRSVFIGIILLTIVVHLFTYWISDDMPLNIQWYLKLLYHAASLLLVIGLIEFFYYNNKSASINNKHLSLQYEISKQKLNDSERQEKDVISISLEKEQIEINRNKIVYIQSVSNYLEFYLREPDGKINKITKRGRLHKTEKDLSPFLEFFKCHRAFIINLEQSAHLKGNMKNARVVFEGVSEEIPVSRTFYKTLKESLEKITLG